MYDREEILRFAGGQMATNAGAVECLLDFSRGPDAMLVTMKKPCLASSKEGRDFKIFEMRYQNNKPRAEPASSQTDSNKPTIIVPASSPISINSIATKPKPRAVCSFCGKPFAHIGDHNKHRRRHTGERPYGCELCPRRFGHASNLARHRRLHSGEKPYECTGCSRRFSRKDKLGLHVARKCCAKRRRPAEGQSG